MRNLVQACLSQILKILTSFIKQCLNESFKIHLISEKPRSHTAPYCIFLFNCLHLLISLMPVRYRKKLELSKSSVTVTSALVKY